jgi:hypothetical protein
MVNQQQPSAGWFRLGVFSMAPGQDHGIEVTGALEGVTVVKSELPFVVFMVPNPKPRHSVTFKYSQGPITQCNASDQIRSSWFTHLKCREGWKGVSRQRKNALRVACFTGAGTSA